MAPQWQRVQNEHALREIIHQSPLHPTSGASAGHMLKGYQKDFGVKVEEPSVQPGWPLAATFGDLLVWFGAFACKSQDRGSSVSGFTALSKRPLEEFAGGKARHQKEAKG